MISGIMFSALKILSRSLVDVDWALAGSANLALQGIDINVHDIDILTKKEFMRGIEFRLKDYLVSKARFYSGDKFRAYCSVYEINNTQIEVIACLERNVNGIWVKKNDFNTKEVFPYKGLDIPVMSLEDECLTYEQSGRIYKARKIRDFSNTRVQL